MLKVCDIAAKPLVSFIRAPFLISKIVVRKLLSNFCVLPKVDYYEGTLCFDSNSISIMLLCFTKLYLMLVIHLGCKIMLVGMYYVVPKTY